MLGLSKLVIAAISASLVSGGALLALTGAGPGAGGSDYGLDTDGDGRFDWLVVRMPLTVEEPNHYNVWATLGTREPFGRGCFAIWPQPGDPTMPPIREGEPYPGPLDDPDLLYPISWASVRVFLEAGDHAVSLAFQGTDIGYAGVDGPYVVHAQVFADGQWGPDPRMGPGILPPEPSGWSWTYTTGAYGADLFEEPRFAIRFTGTVADHGLDTDGDGLYDYLVLEAPADVALAGTYAFDASLMVPGDDPDRGKSWVTSAYGTVDLREGRQTVEARLNGGDIWASGHSGAYDFTLSVYYGGDWYDGGNGTTREGEGSQPGGGDFDVYGDSLCGATSEYRHEQWEERVEPATFTGVFADRGEDYDGDGLFDVLAVDAEVDVAEANWFEFSGQLMSSDGTVWIAGDYQGLYLDVGVQTVTLHFSGPAIHASGVDGPYRVDMNLVAWMRDPQATYTTGAYTHTEFDPEERTRPKTHWIADLAADATAISVLVQRGDDLLTVVIEDVLTVQAVADDGTVLFEGTGTVYLPSGGASQAFTFAWDPEPGTYIVMAFLGDPAQPTDAVRIVVTV